MKRGHAVQVSRLIAGVVEKLAGGVRLEISVEQESKFVAMMAIETGSSLWKISEDTDPVNADEFLKNVTPGCILEIDGTIELRGPRKPCTPADLSKFANRYWVLPRRVDIRYAPIA